MKKSGLLAFIICMAITVFAGTTITDKLKLRKNGVIEFEGATNNNFETTLSLVDPTADNQILFKDASGTVAFLSDISCGTVSGSGTGGRISIWTGCGASTVLGDSFIRQACGDVLFDDGVNDILTFDFTTNPTGAITWTLGNVSGVPAIDNGIAACDFVIGTATDGELIGSQWAACGNNLVQKNTGSVVKTGRVGCNFSLDYFDFRTDDLVRFRINNNVIVDLGATGFDFFTTDTRDFKIQSPTFPFITLNKTNGCDFNWDIRTCNIGTTNRAGQLPDMNGTFAMWEKSTQTLTADCTVITITSSYLELSSDSATATDRTFTISTTGLVPGQEFSLGWQGGFKGELENTGIMSLTGTWLPDDEDVVPLIFDGTNIRENGSRAANRDH